MSRQRNVEDDYRDNVGRDPVERYPEGHPDHWQWKYRGTPEERAELEALLGAGYLGEDEVAVTVDPDQESLF